MKSIARITLLAAAAFSGSASATTLRGARSTPAAPAIGAPAGPAQPFPDGFVGNAVQVQFWDATHSWTPGVNGAQGTCTTGLVGISENAAQATNALCPCNRGGQNLCPKDAPTVLGQVTPCNPAAANAEGTTEAASGAVVEAPRYARGDKDMVVVPNVATEPECAAAVAAMQPLQAGAVFFQDLLSTKGTGTAQNWWRGAKPLSGGFNNANAWGGTQMSWVNEAHTSMNVMATGGGAYSDATQQVNLCPTATYDADACVKASLFGSGGKALPNIRKGGNGAFNIFFVTTPSN